MADLETMIPRGIPIETQAGAKYVLPRLTIRTRRAAFAFISKIEEIKQSGVAEVDQIGRILDEVVTLLTQWLGRNYPDITAEQIEEDWDIVDVPSLISIITSIEAEVQAASPPDSSVPDQAQE